MKWNDYFCEENIHTHIRFCSSFIFFFYTTPSYSIEWIDSPFAIQFFNWSRSPSRIDWTSAMFVAVYFFPHQNKTTHTNQRTQKWNKKVLKKKIQQNTATQTNPKKKKKKSPTIAKTACSKSMAISTDGIYIFVSKKLCV